MSLDQAPNFVKQQTLTRDAFLDGRLIVSQPAAGFRAGLDSVLLGAAVRANPGAILDLGAGAGTASLVALAHRPAAAATLVEADAGIAAIAALNLRENCFEGRARLLVLDVTAPGRTRARAGLPSDHFATVIANPPFFDSGGGTAASGERDAARRMQAGTLEQWVKAAASHAAPGGEAIFIYPAPGLPALLAAFGRRFGGIAILPLCPREGQPASRVLVRGIKGSKAPASLFASRALHEAEGRSFRPEFEAIFRGRAALDW